MDEEARKGTQDLQALRTAIRKFQDEAVELSKLKVECEPLTHIERRTIVWQALVYLEQHYVHLPMKRALYGIDPVQQVKLLLQAVDLDDASVRDDGELHRQLLRIFLSLRDPHTRYFLPDCWKDKVAYLPFMVEDIEEDGHLKYIVSKALPEACKGSFGVGVELVYWNAVPIESAVRNHAQKCAASNREARHAEGVMGLALRVLREAPAPDEHWVDVGYHPVGDDSRVEWQRFHWKVGPKPWPEPGVEDATLTPGSALNTTVAGMKSIQLALYAPDKLSTRDESNLSRIPEIFTARPVVTAHGEFGYLRIWSFKLEEDDFVAELARLLALLPARGLIVDIRENPGGKMAAAECSLQLLTPRRIEPEPLQFINTMRNLDLAVVKPAPPGQPELKRWIETITEGLQTGAVHSAGFPQLEGDKYNNSIEKKYSGPVVLIVDALCYSAADVFAAGFQDHEIGWVLGTDERTGAGGANSWEHERFRKYELPEHRSLGAGVSFKIAIRRSLRVRRRAGLVLEDFGVKAEHVHRLTRRDVLEGNKDLIDTAASLLEKPRNS